MVLVRYQPKPPGLGLLFLMQLTNIIIVLLIISGIGSIIVNATNPARSGDPMSYVEGIAIFLIVVINAGIAAYTEKGANDALEALSKMTAPNCKVRARPARIMWCEAIRKPLPLLKNLALLLEKS